jgi:TRAP-type mannitol/chloroaromatic compound transport system permease small subunit
MDRLLHLTRRLSQMGAWIGGWLVLIAAAIVGVDVTIRKLFAISLGGADELAGYALAIASAWTFGFALFDRAHIRIDSLYVLLPAWLRAALDLIGLASLVAFIGLVTWHGYGVLALSIKVGARSMTALETPLAVPQALWIAGMVTFLWVGLLLFVSAGAAFARGAFPRVMELIGSRSALDETKDEVRAAAESRERMGMRP